MPKNGVKRRIDMSEEIKQEEKKNCGCCDKNCGEKRGNNENEEELVCETAQGEEKEEKTCCGEKQNGKCEKHEKCANADANAEMKDEDMKNEKGEKCEKKKKLFAEIDELKKEAEENKRKWYAVTAEYENYRRRTEKQSATRYADGRNDVVAKLFPVGDNLARALTSCADEQTKKGLEMVLKSFDKVLADEGIEEIDPTGKPFSADEAEAIMAVPAENGEESGTVKQVYLKGYKKGEKVLRYAQVVVVS